MDLNMVMDEELEQKVNALFERAREFSLMYRFKMAGGSTELKMTTLPKKGKEDLSKDAPV